MKLYFDSFLKFLSALMVLVLLLQINQNSWVLQQLQLLYDSDIQLAQILEEELEGGEEDVDEKVEKDWKYNPTSSVFISGNPINIIQDNTAENAVLQGITTLRTPPPERLTSI